MFRSAVAVCAVLLPILAAGAPVAKRKPVPPQENILPFAASEKTLDNGLRVIAVPTGFPNIVAVYITVQTGSRNEVEPGKSGFAHFFEHMMFRGTPSYPPEAYQAIMTKAGATSNANTSDDRTIYYTTFAKDDLPKVLEVEADRFQHLTYSPEAFKTEARAILGEYNKNSANPIAKLDEAQRDAAYTTHTYKHTTMGFIKDIEDMPNQYDYSKVFFRRWYRPEKAAIIVAGDIDPANVLALVEKYWSGWKRGDYVANIPPEPPAKGPVYAHVAWPSPTLPWVTVAFHGPSFLQMKEQAALDTAFAIAFGETSDIYKKLVEDEQKVDQLFADTGQNVDPSLVTVYARVKNINDAVYVRDEILKTFGAMRSKPLDAQRVNETKSNARYSFLRRLDNTNAIANVLANFALYERSYQTANRYYRALADVTPADIEAAAQKYFSDANLVVATLSKDPMPAAIEKAALPPVSANAAGAAPHVISQKTVLPNVMVKMLFTAGSANDPQGKEGLAALAASMISEAGSKSMRTDEISKALYPIAGSFSNQVDKEITTFTGVVHRDNWHRFLEVVLPQLLSPGLRQEDFQRLKDLQLNHLKQDLRGNNDEELGKEELQNVLFAGTPYGHTAAGTIAGIEAIALDDVRDFIAGHYTRANLVVGLSGDYPQALADELNRQLADLPAGQGAPKRRADLPAINAHQPSGLEVEIIQKETRATAISMGRPIPITRQDPDFAALNVARSWLGEHRASSSHLYQRIREARGLNYGDYAYIESFNHPGFQFFPSPNIGRRSQLFEIWIRPVVPVNAQMAMRIALYEVQKLIDNGMSQEDFENTRDFLMKNVYLMTANQNQRLGYALDSWWFGMPEFTESMRSRYAKLTRDDVNRAIKKYFSAKDLAVVIVTKDAQALRDQLAADQFSEIKYDAPKPQLAQEDKIIGAYKLNIAPEKIRIVPVDNVFGQ
ncbi:MAG TPA: pitrilysin family protein [Thermoanaerobaculia bacterium]|nr:pitrilysin family protein [Thermoanaerobaculia bacterium]